jgi:hypothetical protein
LEAVKGIADLILKEPRLKLVPEQYAALRRQVLERDGWRCQVCGSSAKLQVHHLRRRSKLGGDENENLITLCAACHHQQHAGSSNSPSGLQKRPKLG